MAKGCLLNKLFLSTVRGDKVEIGNMHTGEHASKIADSIAFTLSQPDSALEDLTIGSLDKQHHTA